MDEICFAIMLLAFIWLIFELIYEFGPIVILLLLTGIGAFIVAVMTLVGIRATWKPIALFVLAAYAMLTFTH